jgi:ceramide glucosyltransferase
MGRFAQERTRRRASGFTPPVSILKPLCGADPRAYESLRSHCEQDYPEFEIIFGVSDPNDVAVQLVQRLIQEFPERRIQLVVCPGVFGSNFKVSNLIQMIPEARHAHLLVNDSDIAVSPVYLRDVMAEFQEDRAGLTTCLYRGIAGRTVGSKLEALGINTDFIPGVLSACQVEGGIRFGLGSTLAFRRKALDAIGGFESIADYLGDDYELGKRISDAGYDIKLAKSIVDHYIPDYSFADFLRHQIRWARTVHDSRPGGFAGLVLTFGFFWSLVSLILMPDTWWAWALAGLTISLRIAVALRAGGILKPAAIWRHLWLLPIRDLLSVGVWAVSYTGRRIVWRGNQFTLENGKLRP